MYFYIIQFVQRKYNTKGAILEAEMGVEFESDSISLQEAIREDGWQIISVFHPMVSCVHCEFWKKISAVLIFYIFPQNIHTVLN